MTIHHSSVCLQEALQPKPARRGCTSTLSSTLDTKGKRAGKSSKLKWIFVDQVRTVVENRKRLLAGCKCKKGCSNGRCGCKRLGKVCNASCTCIGCINCGTAHDSPLPAHVQPPVGPHVSASPPNGHLGAEENSQTMLEMSNVEDADWENSAEGSDSSSDSNSEDGSGDDEDFQGIQHRGTISDDRLLTLNMTRNWHEQIV